MVLAKSKNSAGLGNSLMNDRFGKGKASNMKKASHNAAIVRQDPDGNSYVTNAPKQAAWMKMRSVTEQQALDEFLSTAELANTDFTAEKMHNVKIIHADQKNPYLLSATEEQSAIRKQSKNRNRLTVPRRPDWDATTTREELDRRERANLLEWRRGLAELQENNDLLMTPFERNIEVWRQLWRVIERSDLVVQIVDARNPLLFRCDDLETYVRQIDPKKRNLLLINKADMLTDKQRVMWADYFEREKIDFRFFSAHLAKERNERLERGEMEEEDKEQAEEELAGATDSLNLDDGKRRNIEILDVEELEELFLSNAPDKLPENDNPEYPRKQKTTIGLVGYPNVGKSSTINALLGSKKVSVSATPGKTKHFQTLYLTPEIMLCDCPGLVFPNFASTKAELVVNGVLPIDQQREFTGPAHLVAQRIPKTFLENIYGMRIITRPLEEGGTGIPTSHELLRAYARARGFSTQGLGQPDESRAARYVLKDYVNGKLLYCHPPPPAPDAEPIDPAAFNHDLYDIAHLPPRRQAALLKTMQAEADANVAAAARSQTSAGADDESQEAAADIDAELLSSVAPEKPGLRSRNLDTGFFGPGSGTSTGRITLPFNAQYTAQGQEMRKPLTGRKERLMVAMERGIDPSEVRKNNSKKHFKANKRQAKKTRKAGEEDDY